MRCDVVRRRRAVITFLAGPDPVKAVLGSRRATPALGPEQSGFRRSSIYMITVLRSRVMHVLGIAASDDGPRRDGAVNGVHDEVRLLRRAKCLGTALRISRWMSRPSSQDNFGPLM